MGNTRGQPGEQMRTVGRNGTSFSNGQKRRRERSKLWSWGVTFWQIGCFLSSEGKISLQTVVSGHYIINTESYLPSPQVTDSKYRPPSWWARTPNVIVYKLGPHRTDLQRTSWRSRANRSKLWVVCHERKSNLHFICLAPTWKQPSRIKHRNSRTPNVNQFPAATFAST